MSLGKPLLNDEPGASVRTFVGLLVALLVVGGFPVLWTGHVADAHDLAAPLGASATLMALTPNHPFAAAKAVVLGNLVAAVIGLSAAALVHVPLLAAAVALAMSVVALRLLGITHPPASGMAVMAALGGVGSLEGAAGFLLVNVLISAVVLTVVMLLVNRVSEGRVGGGDHLA